MKLLILLLGLLLLSSACTRPATPAPAPVSAPTILRVRSGDRVISVPLEDYVLGSALSEVSPVGDAPATVARIFAVQTILARTYALAHLGRHRQEGFDLCDTTHCQLYEPARIGTSRFTDVARQAVAQTRNTVLLFSDRPADALYHSDCGGHTAAANVVWGGVPVAYLAGTKDDVPALVHRQWQFDAPVERLRAALGLDSRSDVGRRLDKISVVDRDPSGRAASVEVHGSRAVTVKGDDFRAILNKAFGDRAMLSTRFSVARAGATFHFKGSGFGHGVGLCQVGAAARARHGESLEMILATYFPGTTLASVRPQRLTGILVGPGVPDLLNSP